MTKTGCSYGAVEDPRGGRCYGRDTTTTTTSHTSTNSKHDGVGMVSDGPDLRQCEDEARPSGKRRAAFGTGVVMIVLASSMVVGYVFGLTVAGVTEEEGVDVLLADTADARDRTSFTGREFTMEDEADEFHSQEHEELFSFRSLSLEARNEYGVFDALALYGLDMVVEPYKETTLSAVTMEWTTPDSSFGDGPVGYWGNSRPTWADHAIKDSDTAIGTLDDSRWGHDPDGGKGRTRYYYGTDCCQRGDDDDDGSGSGGRHNRGKGGGGDDDDDGSGSGGRHIRGRGCDDDDDDGSGSGSGGRRRRGRGGGDDDDDDGSGSGGRHNRGRGCDDDDDDGSGSGGRHNRGRGGSGDDDDDGSGSGGRHNRGRGCDDDDDDASGSGGRHNRGRGGGGDDDDDGSSSGGRHNRGRGCDDDDDDGSGSGGRHRRGRGGDDDDDGSGSGGRHNRGKGCDDDDDDASGSGGRHNRGRGGGGDDDDDGSGSGGRRNRGRGCDDDDDDASGSGSRHRRGRGGGGDDDDDGSGSGGRHNRGSGCDDDDDDASGSGGRHRRGRGGDDDDDGSGSGGRRNRGRGCDDDDDDGSGSGGRHRRGRGGDDDDDGSGSGGRHNRGRGGGGDDDGSGGGGRQDDDSSGRKWPCRCGSWRRKSSWVLTRLDDEGTPIPDAPPLLNITLDVDDDQDGGEGYYGGGGALSGGGERIDGPTITLTEGGTQYLLVVTEMFEDGEVIGEGRATVSCRYVRRELRELTTGDRDAFMDAMVEFYTAPTVVTAGGPDDRNYQYFAAVHDAKEFCYHNGMMFLTAHLAFDWEMEKELQKINPAVSLAFWDYTIESGTLGADWPQSEIFGPSMFGSALGSEDNGFMVSDGRFANVSSIYDPKSLLTSTDITPVTNSYGYVSAKYDYQDVEKLSRTHSFCGFTGTTAFPQCEAVIRCFDDNKSLQAWSTCMEDNIHADMHGWLGGAWGCETDMGHFKEEHPEFSDDLLVFVLQFATASRWSTNALFDDYNECDTACTRGSPEPCGCHCLLNPATMSNDEVYTALEHVMVVYSTIFNADYFIYHDRSAKYEYNFMQDGVPLTDKEFMLLLRFILTVGCKPANIGAMSTGASPTDPLFWMIHPMFERALHVLWLSPEYKDTYDFSWTGSGCYGSALTDNLPFTEKSLGQGSGTSFLTNEDILRIAHPSNSKLPYLYNNFDTWGTCTDWNPCPDCV